MLTVEQQLATVALGLPPKKRAKLASLLLQSISTKNAQTIADTWADEATARLKAHRKGKLKSISTERAFGFSPGRI